MSESERAINLMHKIPKGWLIVYKDDIQSWRSEKALSGLFFGALSVILSHTGPQFYGKIKSEILTDGAAVAIRQSGGLKMLSKKYAQADQKRCAACGACMKECPKDAVQIWKGCYALIDREQCIGCGKCSRVCPADCIQVRAREEVWRKNTGMIIYGSGPSSIFSWDSLIFFSHGSVWLIFLCRCLSRWSAATNGSATIYAAVASFLLKSAENGSAHAIKKRRNGWRRRAFVMGFSYFFWWCSETSFSKPVWSLPEHRLWQKRFSSSGHLKCLGAGLTVPEPWPTGWQNSASDFTVWCSHRCWSGSSLWRSTGREPGAASARWEPWPSRSVKSKTETERGVTLYAIECHRM